MYNLSYGLLLGFCLLGTLWLPAALLKYEPGSEGKSYQYVAAFFATELTGLLLYFVLATL